MTKKLLPYVDEYYENFNAQFGDDARFSLFVRTAVNDGGPRVREIHDDFLTSEEATQMMNQVTQHEKGQQMSFDSNLHFLEPAGYCCTAMRKGKFTIDVYGNVYKCDSICEENCIGKLDDRGRIVSNGISEAEWVTYPWRNDPECEECFLSAVCFKGTCPMQQIVNRDSSCQRKTDTLEIDTLIYMFEMDNDLPQI